MSEGDGMGFSAKIPGCDDVMKQANFQSTRSRTSLKFKSCVCTTKNFSVKSRPPGAAVTR